MTESNVRNISFDSVLKTQMKDFNWKKLKAQENESVISGYQTLIDLPRMDLIINGVEIDRNLVIKFVEEVKNNSSSKELKKLIDSRFDDETIEVLTNESEEKESFIKLRNDCNKQYYHQVLTEAFLKVFQHAKAKVPSEHLIQELIVNLNQAGYYGTLCHGVFIPSIMGCNLVPHSSTQMVHINCDDVDRIELKISEKINMSKQGCSNPIEEVLASLSGLVKFTLQNDKDNNINYVGMELSDITLQVSEEWTLEQNKGLFLKLIEWIQNFLQSHFGVKTSRINMETIDKPKTEIKEVAIEAHQAHQVDGA
ncbi:MAG: hypothetical protein U0X86_000594 [Wolbachia endosymbiont of Xenopsylla cheopis]